MSKTPEEKLKLMEKAYTQWLKQKNIAVKDVGFDPIHPLFAGWSIGFEDGASVHKNYISFKNIMFLILGIGLGSLI